MLEPGEPAISHACSLCKSYGKTTVAELKLGVITDGKNWWRAEISAQRRAEDASEEEEKTKEVLSSAQLTSAEVTVTLTFF